MELIKILSKMKKVIWCWLCLVVPPWKMNLVIYIELKALKI
jgi:hypothetical protein